MEKREYKFLDLKQRKEILDIFETCSNEGRTLDCCAIATKFNVSVKTIYRMKNSKFVWNEKFNSASKMPCYSKRKKVSQQTEMESNLYDWFKQKRVAGEPISGAILKEKALLLNEEIENDHDFMASEGWFTRFKQRYEIRSCSVQGKKLSGNLEAAVEFVEELRQKTITPSV